MINHELNMGVSHYFRWLVSKLEKDIITLNHPHDAGNDDPVDFLYLDLNCAIHPVVKADSSYTLSQMYDAVLAYIEKELVARVKPQQLVYIAIDGIAPQAKMNQQRSRRYKTIYDSQCLEKMRVKYGEPHVPCKHDFNMISPATEFMTTLADRIRQSLLGWEHQFHTKFQFSDSLEPGEGEHKIMAHIRQHTTPRDQIVVYGLDSDLIFLCLGNYRPGIALLREIIHFGKGLHVSTAEGTEFCYLSIDGLRMALLKFLRPHVSVSEMESFGIFRRYRLLNDDFRDLEALVQSGFCSTPEDDQRLIDDYIYICFLLGNDFLPTIPSLKINENGLDILLQAYKLVMWRRREFIVSRNDGSISVNVEFVKDLFKELSELEGEILRGQTHQRERRITDFYKHNRDYLEAQSEYEKALVIRNNIELNEPDPIQPGFAGWKKRYYQYHFHLDSDNPTEYYKYVRQICLTYLRGMQWTIKYYLQGIPDWNWSYNYNCAPVISDLVRHMHDVNQIVFQLGKPSTAFAQLMYILPPQSAHLLPQCLQWYMNDDRSPIVDQYPQEISIDCLGKRMLWECHPKLPSVDLKEFENIIRKNLHRMTSIEHRRGHKLNVRLK